MLFLLLAFEDDHRDVAALLRLDEFLFDLAHELDIDIDLLVWLQLTSHRSDGEHLLRDGLLHAEVEADRVLTLILQIQWKLFRLANTNSSEVKLSLHAFVESDVECL